MNYYSLVVNVGARKAGTSWLFKCLEEHPQMCTAKGKETHFFSLNYTGDISNEYIEKYYSHCLEKPVLYDSSTTYLYNEECPERIRDFCPDAKIIIILRDPIARSISHFKHVLYRKHIKSTSIIEAVKEKPEILSDSQYKKNIERFRDVFPEEQILLIDYRQICEDPQGVLNEVCAFTNISKFSPKAMGAKYNTHAARSNPLYNRITRIYLKLNRSRIGRKSIEALRYLGLNSLILEKLLIKNTSNHHAKTDTKFLETELQEEITNYNNLFQ